MPFQIIRNDIARVKADVIVNTANPEPVIGRGTDSAIYAAAGEEKLLACRKEIGRIAPGQAAATPAFLLHARYILHTVGPVWVDGNRGEREILHACYTNCLSLAFELRAESIAFPLIATGIYGFPREEALSIALEEISRFLLTHEMQVILVVFDRDSFELSAKLIREIDEYIDDNGVKALRAAEYPFLGTERETDAGTLSALSERRETDTLRPETYRRQKRLLANSRLSESLPDAPSALSAVRSTEEEPMYDSAPLPDLSPDFSDAPLDELLDHTGETFQQRLLHLIDESGMTNAEVYKKANIDRRVFSRMQSRKDYRPKKVTAVAFAIALRLDMDSMTDLLSRAEIALSPSSKFDLIISYFVSRRIYDIFEINAVLFKYGQPILGEA